MKHPETLPFTNSQLYALRESQTTINLFSQAMTGHEITYDREQDSAKDVHPDLYSMDKIWAEMGMGMRNALITLADKELSVTMISSRANNEAVLFDDGAEAYPYSNLLVTHRGLLSYGPADQTAHEQHQLYTVNQPESPYHGLGIISGAIIEVRHEVVPIDDESQFGLKEATRRLGSIAKTAANQETAEEFMAAAEAAERQTHIPVTSYEAVSGWHIASAERARHFGRIISLVIESGEPYEA
jgi:hypothetical protein